MKLPARTLATVVGVLVAVSGVPARADVTPTPAPLLQFRPANVPWPLSTAQARKAARAEAVRAWGARNPKVVSVHRVSYSKVDCRVTWRTEAGGTRARTVTVKRTSTYGVQAAPRATAT